MRIILTAALLLFTMTMSAATKTTQKTINAEPANWYVDMKDPSLQILLYGKDIRESDVTTDYPGVTIDSLVRLESPNYLLVYLNLKDAKPGDMKLNLTKKNGKGKALKTVISYPLLARDMAGAERKGFSNEDVLYMLMPDRFAQGNRGSLPTGEGGGRGSSYTVNRSEPSLRHGGNLTSKEYASTCLI